MEESSEAHMDTDVSSTTEDVVEVQDSNGPHCNVETVIVVEVMKEEDMRKERERLLQEKADSIPVSAKTPEKSPQKDGQIKKIIIKSPFKEFLLKTPQNSPVKSEEAQKSLNNDLQNKPAQPSNLQQAEDVVDSSSKTESAKSPKNDEISQKSPMKECDAQKNAQKTPVSASDQISATVKDPDKANTGTDLTPTQSPTKVTPVKDKTLTISLTKDPVQQKVTTIKILPIKEPVFQRIPDKDTLPKITIVKDTAKISPVKEVIKPTTKQHAAVPENIVEPTNKEELIDKSNIVSSMDADIEASNDSQANSDISEKEHNKSISRELRSLINSAKESKIISECTQLTSKTRKSRTPLDSSITNLNTSVEADKIIGVRRGSDNSQKSGCSEKSDKTSLKRSMRSQNPEFVSKVKNFLNSVTGKGQKEEEDTSDEEVEIKNKERKENDVELPSSTPKKKKVEEKVPETPNKLRSDAYCWRCHWQVEQAASEKQPHPQLHCTVCPRTFHFKCLTGPERNKINLEKNWVCPECLLVLHAESSETRSPAMKKISLGMLCELLKHALDRMMDLNGVEPFMHGVDRTIFPDYDKYIVHPMDLSLMKEHINESLYGSTEAFMADAQWILHNSIIFNTLQSKLTSGARALVRSCRAEMGEIEACPECYAAAHARRPTWFTDVCTTPHILLWAKLKGFPYWPAKGMSVSSAGLVDVRFFGAHDRAWVPAKDCFLFSEKDPNNFRTKRQDILDSMQEAEQHIRNISRKYGKFVYPPFKTQFDPTRLCEQLKMMIPSFEGEVRTAMKDKLNNSSPGIVKKKNSRSNSKSSKGSFHDGDTSEGEDASAAPTRKMADGAEIAREEDDEKTADTDKDKTMDLDVSLNKETPSRKRRCSNLEEAVITILDISTKEKRKRVESDDKTTETITKESKEPTSAKEVPVKLETKTADKVAETPPKPKETSNSVEKKTSSKTTPIRLISITKVMQNAKQNSPKEKEIEKAIQKPNPILEKSNSIEKDKDKCTPDDKKSLKRRNSKSNKSLNNSSFVKTDKNVDKNEKPAVSPLSKDKQKDKNVNKTNDADKSVTDKIEKPKEKNTNKSNDSITEKTVLKEKIASKNDSDKSVTEKTVPKEKNCSKSNETNKSVTDKTVPREKNSSKSNDTDKSVTEKVAPKEKNTNKINDADKSVTEKSTEKSTTDSQKTSKNRVPFDDDTSLAVLARHTAKSATTASTSVLPTISSVRSLSSPLTGSTIKNAPKTIEITVEATSTSSIFTPTSTDNVRNMKEAVDKLQKLRETEPPIGRVGVRAFARMTSPEPEPRPINDVQVDIKTEPMDLDDADRQMEKLDLMNAFRLRPVNPPSNLREVRINKVVVTPVTAKKPTPKVAEVREIRPRAKKTFPQPKKADEGRSELNSKNSMVYIPIQPPMTQAPVPGRVQRPANNGPGAASGLRVTTPATSTVSNHNAVNTVTTPLLPGNMSSLSSPTTSTVTSTSTSNSTPNMPTVGPVPTVGQVPTTVHTVPLITTVNGQWTFSLQPVMSVGGVDGAPSPPMTNGLPDCGTNVPALVPLPPSSLAPTITSDKPTLVPAFRPIAPVGATQGAVRNTDSNLPVELPRLQQRPSLMNPLDPGAPLCSVPPPSTAGPLTAKLNQNAVKMTDFFRTLLEDSLDKVEEPLAQVTALKLQLEQINWKHQQQIDEIKHNYELSMAEIRSSFEKDKVRLVAETRRAAQCELENAVKLAKSKQWCANCTQEAQFYCCWNTSYCDYPCQRAHWAQHYAVCTQQRSLENNDGSKSPPESRLQPQPESLPKTTAAPSLVVGNKLAPSRVYTQESPPVNNVQKPSIIVSMVEDMSGNQTMKCVGTYKPQMTPTQMSPLILNKQILNSDEAKKVVTSGGYLIVGAAPASVASTNQTALAPARRTHTIQYYT